MDSAGGCFLCQPLGILPYRGVQGKDFNGDKTGYFQFNEYERMAGVGEEAAAWPMLSGFLPNPKGAKTWIM